MKRELSLRYGADTVSVALEDPFVLAAPAPLPRVADVAAATREALARPFGQAPLSSLAGPGAKVLIAFDDPAVFTFCDPDPREEMLSAVLGELLEAGVNLTDIHLLCANALHRQWTRRELASLLGEARVLAWPLHRLSCHDAEDPSSLEYLGETRRGFEVEVSRRLLESDLTIYLSVPMSPMNGGWKSTAVGLSSFRSIRHHHRPFPGASHSVMDPHKGSFHKLLRELGEVVAARMARDGKQLLQVEAVLDNRGPWSGEAQGVIGVFAGAPNEAHAQALALLEQQLVTRVEAPRDILLIGLPDQDPYSRFAIQNPILATNLGLSYTYGLHQGQPLARPGGILILLHPFEGHFDDIHHPSYREFFTRVLAHTQDPTEAWDLFADDFAHRPEYVHKYRYGYGFHGTHPFFMWNQTAAPRRHLGGIFVAGARDPEVVRRLGFTPFADVDSAVREARARLGQGASLAVHPVPPISIARVGA